MVKKPAGCKKYKCKGRGFLKKKRGGRCCRAAKKSSKGHTRHRRKASPNMCSPCTGVFHRSGFQASEAGLIGRSGRCVSNARDSVTGRALTETGRFCDKKAKRGRKSAMQSSVNPYLGFGLSQAGPDYDTQYGKIQSTGFQGPLPAPGSMFLGGDYDDMGYDDMDDYY